MKVPSLTLPQARLLLLIRLGGRLFRCHAEGGKWYVKFTGKEPKRVSDTVAERLVQAGYIDESGRETRDGERKFDLRLAQWRLPE